MVAPSSGAISISDLKAAFPAVNSNSLSAYRGVKWYRSNNSRGLFGNPTISLSEGYDTRPNSPVTPWSGYLSSGSWTVPLFNTLYIECKGGNGGQGGANGIYYGGGPYNGVVTGGAGGSPGGDSYITDLLSASGGSGGGGNSGGGGTGATTSRTITITDSDQSQISLQGTSHTVNVGGGGGGGGGGENHGWYADYVCYWYNGCGWTDPYYHNNGHTDGSPGSAGYVYVSIT